MDNDVAISRVLGTLTQLASPAGRPGARMLPLDVLKDAFVQFIEYAETLRGSEHSDAGRHLRALPFIRDLAPLVDRCWALDAVPRDITLMARLAMDAWFPESGGADFWAQTDRDAELWTAHIQQAAQPQGDDHENQVNRDEYLLRMALGQTHGTEDDDDTD